MTAPSLLASLLLLLGLWLTGSKCRHGFACTIAGESLWVIIAANRGAFDLSLLCVAFVAVAVRNFRRWSRKAEGVTR